VRPLPSFPFTSTSPVAQWSNFHHTIANRAVAAFLTPGATGLPAGPTGPPLAQALNAILSYCMQDPPERLCTIGSRWSLSNVLDPANVILDPGMWNQAAAVDADWLTDDYKNVAATRGGLPIVVQGGMTIRSLNDFLGTYNLALRASGAADGHRLAGCVATGTHGSHLKIGAVHDTVLAMYIVTGPNQAVLVQPTLRNFTPDMARWFQDGTTFATTDIADDELFNAARVALGGLGFVHSIIIEAVPLYEFTGQTVARTAADADIWYAIETLDTTRLCPTASPDFFTVVFSPYAGAADIGAWATMLWTRPATSPYTPAGPVQSSVSTDLTRLLSALIPLFDNPVSAELVAKVVADETSNQYQASQVGPVFPGSYFGPTTLPEGNGRSVEVVVDHANAGPAVRAILGAFQAEGAAGRHLLGGVGVRFVPATSALLGMNIHPMNAFIEFPSLNADDTSTIHEAVWDALRTQNIPFTCHWGQEYGMDAASVLAYFGDRVDRWKAARQRLLPSTQAQAVFASSILAAVGLA
jgi:hypothetical protein